MKKKKIRVVFSSNIIVKFTFLNIDFKRLFFFNQKVVS